MHATFVNPLKPESPQAIVCCKVSAAALVHLRPGGPGLPNRGFKILMPFRGSPFHCFPFDHLKQYSRSCINYDIFYLVHHRQGHLS